MTGLSLSLSLSLSLARSRICGLNIYSAGGYIADPRVRIVTLLLDCVIAIENVIRCRFLRACCRIKIHLYQGNICT